MDQNNILVNPFASRWNSIDRIKGLNNRQLKNYNRNKYYLIIFLYVLIPIIQFLFIKNTKEKIFKCKDWEVGINGKKILNDKEKNNCKIKNPSEYCCMDFFKGYFDLTKTNNINCLIRDSSIEKKYFFKNIENNNVNVDLFKTKIFAFPHTNLDNKYSLKNQKNIHEFGSLVNQNILDYSNKNKEPEPEAILDFSQDNSYKGLYGELKINLIYNETLSKQRKQMENNDSLSDNIFMVYLDSLSRNHFHRSFPKLSGFIQNLMENVPANKVINAYQFLKYHSFGSTTQFNKA